MKITAAIALVLAQAAQAGHMAPGGVDWYLVGALDEQVAKSATLTACVDTPPAMLPGPVTEGNGSSLVYLTATNTHPHSVEVVVIYNRRHGDPSREIGIYDWGVPKEFKWMRFREFPLGKRFCYKNITRRVNGNYWQNIVKVKVGGRYRTIYASEYKQTEYAQKWWGPIQEEFPAGAASDMPDPHWNWKLEIDGKEWRK